MDRIDIKKAEKKLIFLSSFVGFYKEKFESIEVAFRGADLQCGSFRMGKKTFI